MRSIFLVPTCLALMAAFGCSKDSKLEGLVPVSGTITSKTSPVEGAVVTFAPAGQSSATSARAASGTTDKDGKYVLTTLKPQDGAFPGEYQVTVTRFETKILSSYDDFYANAKTKGKEAYAKGKQPKMSESKNLLPEKYSKAATSGLKATVKQGDKTPLDFTVD